MSDPLWLSEPLLPLRALGNGSAQVHWVRPEGWAWRWEVGRGSPTSLPGSGLTQVRSGPKGWNQVTSPPGGRLQIGGAVRPSPDRGEAEQSMTYENQTQLERFTC